MTLRAIHTDSYRKITNIKSEEFAREMKKRYEENNKELIKVVYNKKEERYSLEYSNVEIERDKRLVGTIDWEEVKEETGRNSIKEGGVYIRSWIEKKRNEGKVSVRRVKINGEYVDTPFRTSNSK